MRRAAAIAALLILALYAYTTQLAPDPPQATERAKCPPGWRVNDPGAFYWRVHTRKHGWSKWHCRPYPLPRTYA